MKYLCLVYQEESGDSVPESACDDIASEVNDHREQLQLNGYLIASSPLQSVREATSVRVRNGKVSITGGPVARTEEQLEGFYLIDARDLNDAIRVASKIPSARIGCIEIRPLREVNHR
jgi:hypothetical protein